MLTKVATTKAPAAIGPYSQGIIVNGMLYASGQIPIIPATGDRTGRYYRTGKAGDVKYRRDFKGSRNHL